MLIGLMIMYVVLMILFKSFAPVVWLLSWGLITTAFFIVIEKIEDR